MARYIDADKLTDKLEELQFNAPTMIPVMKIYNVIELVEDQPTADVVHIDEVFRLIAGHSNYHGDDILAALKCVTEGKEVNPVKPLSADVVEVVRCGECRHYLLWSDGRELHHCDKHDRVAFADDFCSYGERRDT